jgi:hypothetical protein
MSGFAAQCWRLSDSIIDVATWRVPLVHGPYGVVQGPRIVVLEMTESEIREHAGRKYAMVGKWTLIIAPVIARFPRGTPVSTGGSSPL